MPAGYYDVPGLPYPAAPRPPRPRPDPMDLLRDTSMDPDMAIGAQPPRDPYMASLPPRPAQDAATQAAITRLQPSRTEAFSGRDAQALQTLDPRALAEAQSLAALDKPKTMTATFGGKSYEMTPSARVDRNRLAQVYNKYLNLQGQERQDAVRSQEQAGKERIVTIPGEQATQREKIRAEAAAAESAAARAAAKPEQDARIAASQAQADAARARAGREEAEFAERITPEQTAIDAAYERALQSPFAQTPAGRAAIARLAPRTTAGKRMTQEDAAAIGESAAGPAPDSASIAAEIMADPGIAALIGRVKETEPGLFTGNRGRQTGVAARQLAERAIRARVARSGGSPEDAAALITSILGPGADTAGRSMSGIGAFARALPGPVGAGIGAYQAATR